MSSPLCRFGHRPNRADWKDWVSGQLMKIRRRHCIKRYTCKMLKSRDPEVCSSIGRMPVDSRSDIDKFCIAQQKTHTSSSHLCSWHLAHQSECALQTCNYLRAIDTSQRGEFRGAYIHSTRRTHIAEVSQRPLMLVERQPMHGLPCDMRYRDAIFRARSDACTRTFWSPLTCSTRIRPVL